MKKINIIIIFSISILIKTNYCFKLGLDPGAPIDAQSGNIGYDSNLMKSSNS